MYSERWVSESADASNLSAWRRPFKRQANVELITTARTRSSTMPLGEDWGVGPVSLRDHHVWVSQQPATAEFPARFELWGVPSLRLAGMYSPANSEFTTPSFVVGAGTEDGLWINTIAKWHRLSAEDGCDEGCQAYVMVEMRDAAGDAVLGGRTRDKCVLLDVDGVRVPLKWKHEAPRPPVALGTRVTLRVYFRAATVFAIGSSASL